MKSMKSMKTMKVNISISSLSFYMFFMLFMVKNCIEIVYQKNAAITAVVKLMRRMAYSLGCR